LLLTAVDICDRLKVGLTFQVAEELELPLVVVVGGLFVGGGGLFEGAHVF